MKKIVATSPIVLFICYTLIPALALFGLLSGYSLKLRFGEEIMALFGIYSLVVLLNLGAYPIPRDNVNILLSTLLLPFSFISSFLTISYCKSVGSVVFSAVCIFCSIGLFRYFTKNIIFWTLYKFVAIILIIILGSTSLTRLSTQKFDKLTQTYLSPNGIYTVRVTTVDQYTTMDILETDRYVELYVFYYEDIPQTINIEHTEHVENVELTFCDEKTFTVNGANYYID